jgi:lipopolysaccharide transport system permease protein
MLKELWEYRDLVFALVRRDFISLYKQTILGPLWYILSPLLPTLVFTVVFGKIVGLSSDDAPHFLFYYCGLICWGYFSQCLQHASGFYSSHSGIMSSVYFPKLVIPISGAIYQVINFLVQLAMLMGFLVYYSWKGFVFFPGLSAFLFPLLVLQMGLLAIGVGLIMSSFTTRFRDLNHLMGLGIQLLMYASPVIYPSSKVPENFRALYMLNPMAVIIERFRFQFLGVGRIVEAEFIISWLITVSVLVLGVAMFRRVERQLVDTL